MVKHSATTQIMTRAARLRGVIGGAFKGALSGVVRLAPSQEAECFFNFSDNFKSFIYPRILT